MKNYDIEQFIWNDYCIQITKDSISDKKNYILKTIKK